MSPNDWLGAALVMRFISSASVKSSGVSLTFVLIKLYFQLISSHITIYVNVNLDNATGVAPVLEHTPIPDSILFLASEFFLKDTISLTVFFCFFFPSNLCPCTVSSQALIK